MADFVGTIHSIVAGFDFTVSCSETHKPLLRGLLRLVQRLVKDYDLELTYSWDNGEYYVWLDGRPIDMQASLQIVLPYARGFAEGYSEPGRLRDRMRTCERFISAYTESIMKMSERIAKLAADFGGIPHSYLFEVGQKTHLEGPMNDFTRALILAHNNRLSGAQLLETAHTTLELLMKSAIELKDSPFETLVHNCAEKKLINPNLVPDLLKLKNHRKNAKHRGQGIRSDAAWQLVTTAIDASHMLLAAIRRG